MNIQVKYFLISALLCMSNACFAGTNFCEVSPNIKKQKLDFYPEKRDVIAHNFLMSIFSAISYQDTGLGNYQLPDGWHRAESQPDKSGLFIAVFENNERKKLVLAFRGTEALSIKDWIQNLQPFFQPQN